MKQLQDETLAYALLRLTLGMNIFGHGFIRIVGGVSVFVTAQLTGFENTPLPLWFVEAFLVVVPFAELTIGLLVFVGLFSRAALAGGALLMTILTFGMSMQSQFGITGLHLSYAVVYFILIFMRRYNTLSLDTLLRRAEVQ
jgi:thiosulfate dehydrogenase [quinone] large subunit